MNINDVFEVYLMGPTRGSCWCIG